MSSPVSKEGSLIVLLLAVHRGWFVFCPVLPSSELLWSCSALSASSLRRQGQSLCPALAYQPPPSYCSGLADEYIFFVHSPLQSLSLPRPTLNQWLEGKKKTNPVGRFHFCSCVPGGLRWGKASAPTHDLCKPGAALSDASLGRVHKCDSSRRSEIQPSRRPRGGVRKHGDLWSSWRWKIPIMVPSAAGELWN